MSTSIGPSGPIPPFDPMEFLNLARLSVNTTSSEAMLRTSVGRTYYALFLIARERLFPGPVPPRTVRRKSLKGRSEQVGVHKAVIDEVLKRDTATGGKLQKLMELRHAADYWLTPYPHASADWRKNWQDSDVIARQIISRIQRI